MREVICLGEILIDMFCPEVGVPLERASSFVPVPGGAPANVAIGLAKLGIKSALISKVGDDPFGRLLQNVLLEHGVDTSHLKVDQEVRTTLAFISTREDGERDFCFYRNPGADMMLRPEEIEEDFIKGAKVFHYGSISMISEPSYSATLCALEYAKRHNLLISYDPNFRPTLWDSPDRAKKRIIEGLRFCDVVKVNEEELKFITEIDDLKEGSGKILEYGPKIVVVTRGQKGSFFNNGKDSGEVEGFQVFTIDATGCGDAFTAGILAKFLEKINQKSSPLFNLAYEEMVTILKFANAAGALTATKRGVIPSLPPKEAVVAFLNKEG